MEKILIAESDHLFCQDMIRHLRLAGYTQIFYALNGDEALKICQKEQPQIFIIDMSLSDYFGLELPELISAKSVIYGKPSIILLWDSFFVLDDFSLLEKKYHIKQIIKKPLLPDQVVGPVKNLLSEALAAAPSASASKDIPVEYIQIFIESATNFFETMTQIQPKVGQFFFKNDPFSQSDVSARMEIHGTMEGTVCISFDKSVAVFVVSNMLQEEISEFNEDVKDGIGEAVNIITGNTKSFFYKKKVPFNIGLPKIFTGKHYTHPLSPRVPCIVVPFITPKGTLFVEICVQINEDAKFEEEKQPVPTIKEQLIKPQIEATQPDIDEIQAEIAASAQSQQQEEPPAKEAKTGVTQADIEKIQAEFAASAASPSEQENQPETKPSTESEKPGTDPSVSALSKIEPEKKIDDDGKPRIILSKAPLLKPESEKEKDKPKIIQPSKPAFTIEPKKQKTEDRRQTTDDREQRTEDRNNL